MNTAKLSIIGVNPKKDEDRSAHFELSAEDSTVINDLHPTAKTTLIAGTIKTLGDKLLLNEEGNPCDEDEDCIADMSGSTIVAATIDNKGIAWGSVGDSLILTCAIRQNNEVTLKLINPLHSVNRMGLASLTSTQKPLLDSLKYNNPNETGRPKYAGTEMLRSLGDKWQHDDYGMTHTPDVGFIDYSSIQLQPKDQLFVILASDGLFNFNLPEPNNENLKKRYDDVDKKYFNLPKTEENMLAKLDELDLIENDEITQKLEFFKQGITLRNNTTKISASTELANALNEKLIECHPNGLNTAKDNIMLLVSPAGPQLNTTACMVVADGHQGAQSSTFIAENFEPTLRATIHPLIATVQSDRNVIQPSPPLMGQNTQNRLPTSSPITVATSETNSPLFPNTNNVSSPLIITITRNNK